MHSSKRKIEFIKKLKKKGLKLYVAESITGGKFTSELVEIKGASKYLSHKDIKSIQIEINENFKAYGIQGHRHLPEITEIVELVSGYPISINFLPHLIPAMRGIYSTIYVQLKDLENFLQSKR